MAFLHACNFCYVSLDDMKIDPELVQKLKTYQAGVNVHTVNKARCYYEDIRQVRIRPKLDKMIREALATHDWTPLRIYMRRWF